MQNKQTTINAAQDIVNNIQLRHSKNREINKKTPKEQDNQHVRVLIEDSGRISCVQYDELEEMRM